MTESYALGRHEGAWNLLRTVPEPSLSRLRASLIRL